MKATIPFFAVLVLASLAIAAPVPTPDNAQNDSLRTDLGVPLVVAGGAMTIAGAIPDRVPVSKPLPSTDISSASSAPSAPSAPAPSAPSASAPSGQGTESNTHAAPVDTERSTTPSIAPNGDAAPPIPPKPDVAAPSAAAPAAGAPPIPPKPEAAAPTTPKVETPEATVPKPNAAPPIPPKPESVAPITPKVETPEAATSKGDVAVEASKPNAAPPIPPKPEAAPVANPNAARAIENGANAPTEEGKSTTPSAASKPEPIAPAASIPAEAPPVPPRPEAAPASAREQVTTGSVDQENKGSRHFTADDLKVEPKPDDEPLPKYSQADPASKPNAAPPIPPKPEVAAQKPEVAAQKPDVAAPKPEAAPASRMPREWSPGAPDRETYRSHGLTADDLNATPRDGAPLPKYEHLEASPPGYDGSKQQTGASPADMDKETKMKLAGVQVDSAVDPAAPAAAAAAAAAEDAKPVRPSLRESLNRVSSRFIEKFTSNAAQVDVRSVPRP